MQRITFRTAFVGTAAVLAFLISTSLTAEDKAASPGKDVANSKKDAPEKSKGQAAVPEKKDTPEKKQNATENSARWEKDIRAFETADLASPPPQGAVLFVGSSTIRMWKTLAKDFPECTILNRGFGGCHIADCTFFVERIVIPYKPRLIVLRAGGNDIAAGKTPQQVRDDFRAFVERVRAKLPKVRIAYMTIDATPSRWKNAEREKKANQLIKDYIAKGENLDYIDTLDATIGADGKPRENLFVADRLHFNAEGYKILASLVRPHLK